VHAILVIFSATATFIGLCDGSLESLEAAHKDARQPPADLVRLDPRSAIEQHAQYDLGLQAGQRGADAEVRTLPKSDVPLGLGAVEAEFAGGLEVVGVPVGSAAQQQQMRVRGQVNAT
jgi:hypothetical protein